MKKSNLSEAKYPFVCMMFLFLSTLFLFSCQPDSPTPPPAPPTASFTYTSARVFPVQVSFVNNSTSPFPGASTFIWDFGDGTVSTITNPVHFYTVAGTYLVRLVQIYSNATRDTLSKTIQLNINGPSGVSAEVMNVAATDFSFIIPSVYLVTFTNTSTNASSYLWDFGDGTSSTSAATTVTHQYNSAGSFTVKMNATGDGGKDTCSAQIVF